VGMVLVLRFRLVLSRSPTHVRVFFRPPSWRPSDFLLLVQKKVTKEKDTLAAAVTRASMPA